MSFYKNFDKALNSNHNSSTLLSLGNSRLPQILPFYQNFKEQFCKKRFCSSSTCYSYTAQKIKFSITDFSSKCDQIRWKLRLRSQLLEESLTENFIFCAVLAGIIFLTESLDFKLFSTGTESILLELVLR